MNVNEKGTGPQLSSSQKKNMHSPPRILQELLMNKHSSRQASADITDNSVAKMCFCMIRGYENYGFFF